MSGDEPRLSYDQMGHDLDSDPVRIKWAVIHLLELGLVGVIKRGNGRSHSYLPTLPKRLAGSLLAAAAEDEPAPPS